MTRNETIAILETLMSAWPNYRLTDATIVLWCQKFSPTDRADAFKAAQLLIDANANFPTVAEMRGALRSIANRPRPFRPAGQLEAAHQMTADEVHELIADMKARLGPSARGVAPRALVRTPNELDFDARPPVVAPGVSDFDPDNAT